MELDMSFYRGKRVLVTGHSGFKGTWLCRMLVLAGADVTGYALDASTEPSMFGLVEAGTWMRSVTGDIRNLQRLSETFASIEPDIVFHLAAQPIVRDSYSDPVTTYQTNVIGTVNLLECCRQSKTVRSVVNVTTDKVYRNNEWCWAYRENDELDGYDPYSNSKSCSELISRCYRDCFFTRDEKSLISLSTVRAGNVIGGGDFAVDRLIPDCVRAARVNEQMIIRNPESTRPFQHVLDALYAYLMIAAAQYDESCYAGCYNVGPADNGCCRVADVVHKFAEYWKNSLTVVIKSDNGPHEASMLRLDCSRLSSVFRWNPCWDIDTSIRRTAEWYLAWNNGENILAVTDHQIYNYLEERKNGRLE